MSLRPVVSVVVPFYDSEATLGPCLEGLLAQESVGGPVEILAVDNRSSDGSADIARRYPEVTLLHEATPGAYAARNQAVARAQAPIVAFTDSDCVADRDWLRAVIAGLESPDHAILIGHCRYPGTASWALRCLAAYENAKAEYVLDRCDPAYHFAYCNNMAVRASVFAEIGPFETWPRAADSELVHRLAARRPDLRTVFWPAMRITHHEFLRGRDRARRLGLYTQTNQQIATFRELGMLRRLAALFYGLRRQLSRR